MAWLSSTLYSHYKEICQLRFYNIFIFKANIYLFHYTQVVGVVGRFYFFQFINKRKGEYIKLLHSAQEKQLLRLAIKPLGVSHMQIHVPFISIVTHTHTEQENCCWTGVGSEPIIWGISFTLCAGFKYHRLIAVSWQDNYQLIKGINRPADRTTLFGVLPRFCWELWLLFGGKIAMEIWTLTKKIE